MDTPARGPVCLAAHVESLQAAGLSPKTIQARTNVVLRLSASLGSDLSTATTQQLASWLARSGWSRATRAIYRYHIRSYYGWLAAAGLIDEDPSLGLAKVRVPNGPPRPVTDAVLAQILRRVRPPYLVYCVLAAYAGLRCQEIATLEREDVTVESVTVRGKGDKTRMVPTHPLVWRHLAPMPVGPVFHLAGLYLPHVAAHKLSSYGSRTLARAGCKGVTMHQLRHWFGTTTFSRERNIRATQELLGHASIATTQRYTQVSSEERRRAVRALPAVA